MSYAIEKEEIIKRINEEEDLGVINAIRELLDNGSDAPAIHDEVLEQELKISMEEADDGKELPVEDVLNEFRKKYAA